MELTTVDRGASGTRAAVVVDGEHLLLPAADVGALVTDPDWRDAVSRRLDGGSDGAVAPAGSRLAPLVVAPRKVICCGLNYRAHILEMGRPVPEHPTLFTKFADTLTGAHDDIVLPAWAGRVDWEAELTVVIGREVRHATRAVAASAIAGYTVANDISVREWQQHTTQWLPGKAFDATTPVGPVMVTAEAVDPAAGLRITCTVDGEVVQDASTADLVFDAAALVEYVSRFTRLLPGDLLLTGTPGGVGAGSDPPRFLDDGSVVETAIEGIGAARNTVRFAP